MLAVKCREMKSSESDDETCDLTVHQTTEDIGIGWSFIDHRLRFGQMIRARFAILRNIRSRFEQFFAQMMSMTVIIVIFSGWAHRSAQAVCRWKNFAHVIQTDRRIQRCSTGCIITFYSYEENLSIIERIFFSFGEKSKETPKHSCVTHLDCSYSHRFAEQMLVDCHWNRSFPIYSSNLHSHCSCRNVVHSERRKREKNFLSIGLDRFIVRIWAYSNRRCNRKWNLDDGTNCEIIVVNICGERESDGPSEDRCQGQTYE